MKNKQKWWRSQPKAAEGQPSNRAVYRGTPNFREWHNPSGLLLKLFARV
jgi:hypothetical protein